MGRLAKWYRDERDKLQGYSIGFKLEYAWTYYKIWIITIASFIVFVTFAVYTWVTVPDETYFHAVFSNTYAEIGEGSAFRKEFADYAGLDLKQGEVLFNAANYCQPSVSTRGNSYYEYLIAMLDGASLDVWVAGAADVQAVGAAGRLMDLRDERMADVVEAYGDRLVTCTPLEGGGEVPIAIDLTGSKLTGEYSAYPEGAVLGVSANSTRLSMVKPFLDFAFEGR